MFPVLAVMRHGMRVWWKDRRSLFLGLVTPVLLFLVFASIYKSRKPGIPQINVAWIDRDRTRVSEQFLNLLQSDGAVRPFTQVNLPFEKTAVAVTPGNFKSLLKQGEISLAVVILPGFGDQVARFRHLKEPLVRVYYDPTQTAAANMLKGFMTKAGFLLIGENWGKSGRHTDLAENSKTDPHWRRFASLLGQAFRESRRFMRSRGGPVMEESFLPMASHAVGAGEKRNIAAAQQLAGVAVIFLLFSVARAGAVLLDEKQSGTLKRLLSSPLSMTGLVLGKLLAISANGFAQISVMCAAGWAFFGVPVFRSPAALIAMISATAVCAAAFGLFFASFCQTPEQVQASATFLILAMSLVGGSMIPKFLLPPWTQRLSAFTLNGWAMDGFLNVLVRGTGIRGIAEPAGALLLMTALFLSAALALLPRRLYE